jgi:organic hydroperoxide reductase OsmC/OhrA
MSTTPVPKKRYKSFEYKTSTVWKSDRTGSIASDGKPDLDVASPPEFKGVAGVWTPEDLFVAAIDICQMTTFLAFAARADVQLVSYRSAAHGLLEFDGGGYRFTKVTLKPKITVTGATEKTEVERIVHEAHTQCLVGRSVSTAIEVIAEIVKDS